MDWRESLYFIGFLSVLCFGARSLLQWVLSEINKTSVVSRLFWRLSLLGNILLLLHSFIQQQFHVYLIQSLNAAIAWRNLNLMQPPAKHLSFKAVVALFVCVATFATGVFALQAFLEEGLEWFRLPRIELFTSLQMRVGIFWHILGSVGLVLFAGRFWIQWWETEKKRQSTLGPSFWWCSLIGELLCLIYFLHIQDPVNFVGPLCSVVPYVRNLMLLRRQNMHYLQQTR